MKKKEINFQCPNCSSRNVLARINKTRFCRRCGSEWKVKEEKK